MWLKVYRLAILLMIGMSMLTSCGNGDSSLRGGFGEEAMQKCLLAKVVFPCGATAYEFSSGQESFTAFVTGPGAPHVALNERMLFNRFQLCGQVHPTLYKDAECGDMPVFVADRFKVIPPVTRLKCGLAWAVLGGDCVDYSDPDISRPALEIGPTRVLPSDLSLRTGFGKQVLCNKDGYCRIDGFSWTYGRLAGFVSSSVQD